MRYYRPLWNSWRPSRVVLALLLTICFLVSHEGYIYYHPTIYTPAPPTEKSVFVMEPSLLDDATSDFMTHHKRALTAWSESLDGRRDPVATSGDERDASDDVIPPSIVTESEFLLCQSRTYRHNIVLPKTAKLNKAKRDICQVYERDGHRGRISIEYFYNRPQKDAGGLVTLVTHLTGNRLSRLEQVAARWHGSISAALYLSPNAMSEAAREICSLSVLSQRTNIHIHVSLEAGELYPINYMRNLAQSHVTTPYLLVHDIDFLPSEGLEQLLEGYVTHINTSQEVLVVPVFDLLSPDIPAPKNKTELISLWDGSRVQPSLFDYWIHSHNPTNYTKWKGASNPYQVTWRESYEPYIVAKTSVLPAFRAEFVGRWWDKIQFITELKARGLKFIVIPEGFMVHLLHSKESVDQDFSFNSCATDAYLKFLLELERRYRFVIPTELRFG